MSRLMAILLALAVLTLMACGDGATTSESVRLDLGDGIVVAFVKGQSPELLGKVAYVTHVPSGSQAVLDSEGRIIERHNGRDDGTSRLDAVLADEAAMERITRGIQSDGGHLSSRKERILWAPSVKFGGITYLGLDGSVLTADQLGHELHRVAFRLDGYVGSSYSNQDGDATLLNPGTPVYAVKGYSPKFRLATVEGGKVTIYEADTNPQAKIAEDLLDIRGKVTAIDILSEEDATTVLGGIGEESAVSQFVQAALASPVDQEARDHEGERYFLGFRLADGTSVVRSFWMDSGELSRGIMTDPTVATSVRRALSNEDASR